MQHFHNLLYVSHGTTDETGGLKQALSLARNNGAPLKVLVACPEFPRDLPEHKVKFEQSLVDQATSSVRSASEALKLEPNAIQVDVALAIGKHPASRIIQQVLRDGHDLLVKEAETRDRGRGFKAIDMALLRKCPCPVWLTRPISRPRSEIKVAVAIDPESDEPEARTQSLRMLQLARSLADTCSGELHVISCWEYEFEDFLQNTPWVRMDEDAIAILVSGTMTEHAAALQKLLRESEISDRKEIHHLRGEPERLIPKFIEKNGIDILVMGTIARTGIAGIVIGNTAENIIQELTCSLLALKPPGFVSPVKAY
tara:strand:- start:974 stop:1912 length:939 start_codon:yes stop_codon:yes gene_type:complete